MSLQLSSPQPEIQVARSSAQRTQTLAVLAVALAARLLVIGVVVTLFTPRWLFSRGMEMGLLAKSLLAGHGLSSPFGGNTGPTAFIAPVYPILVAAVFRVFGSFSMASQIAILCAQIALNLLTIWLIMRIARQLFNQATATIAGFVWACSPPLIWMPTIFWETSLSCCLLTGLMALVLRYTRQPQIDPVQWLKLGTYCGFAALVNPALLPSLVAIVFCVAFVTRKASGTKPLLAALTFILIFAPWPIRNARTFHAFIPLRTTVGFELWMGNHAGSTGFLDESLFPTFNPNELAEYKTRGEVQYTQHKQELAQQYIASHEKEFFLLTLKRTARFWTGTGTQRGSIFFAIHAVATTSLALAGFLFLLKTRHVQMAILFALPLVLFPLPYFITHAEFRYRLVIDPILTIFAAHAITEFFRTLAINTNRANVITATVNAALISSPLPAAHGQAWRQTG